VPFCWWFEVWWHRHSVQEQMGWVLVVAQWLVCFNASAAQKALMALV
jgi:hypothetical protein